MSGKHVFRPDTRLYSSEQDHLQLATIYRVLRPCIPSSEPARLGPDQLAILVKIAKFRRLDRSGRQVVAQAKFNQFTNRIWLQINADADRLHVCDRLTNLSIYAGGMKAECGCEPPNTT